METSLSIDTILNGFKVISEHNKNDEYRTSMLQNLPHNLPFSQLSCKSWL